MCLEGPGIVYSGAIFKTHFRNKSLKWQVFSSHVYRYLLIQTMETQQRVDDKMELVEEREDEPVQPVEQPDKPVKPKTQAPALPAEDGAVGLNPAPEIHLNPRLVIVRSLFLSCQSRIKNNFHKQQAAASEQGQAMFCGYRIRYCYFNSPRFSFCVCQFFYTLAMILVVAWFLQFRSGISFRGMVVYRLRCL